MLARIAVARERQGTGALQNASRVACLAPNVAHTAPQLKNQAAAQSSSLKKALPLIGTVISRQPPFSVTEPGTADQFGFVRLAVDRST